MAYQIRVRQGGAILSPDNQTIYRGGELVPEGVFTSKQIEEHVRSGYGEAVNIGTPPLPDKLTADPPGIPNAPVLTHKEDQKILIFDGPKPTIETSFPGGMASKVEIVTPKEEKIEQANSLWVLDPANLQGKDLETLNVMIAERDASIPPMETVEEAVAFLSADFKG